MMTKGFLYLDLNGRSLRGFSILKSWAIEWLLYLKRELRRPRGLLYLDLNGR